MYITPEEVMRVTPYEDVTIAQVQMAQFIMEAFTGRLESEVDSPRDKALLARAVAFQTVYMRENPDISFNQMKVGSQNRGDSSLTFRDEYSPFVAPMAAMACNHLTWWNSRSIRVGQTFQHRGINPREAWVTN